MNTWRLLVAAVSVLAILGGAAHAGVETTFVHVNTVEVDGAAYNVYDMMVAPTVDWTNNTLYITLTTGEFYNNVGFGGDTQPSAAFIGLVPDLEWDTYAATPGGEGTPAAFTPRSQFGQNPVTADPAMGNTVIKAGWFDTARTGPGTFKVARLTLSSDAAGTIDGTTFAAPDSAESYYIRSFDGLYTIVGGHIVPDPVTRSLLADGSSVLHVRGGTGYLLWANDASIVNIYGHDMLLTTSGGAYGYGEMTGFWMDSTTPFTIAFGTPDTYTHIAFGTPDTYTLAFRSATYTDIVFDNTDTYTGPPTGPEPASLSLLAVGGLAMMRRRRSART